MDDRTHWDRVYGNSAPDRVSWYQAEAELSLRLIRSAVPATGAAIIDVGGGASTLVDGLLLAGYRRITVLDLSHVALATARARLGAAAASVSWLEADALTAALPGKAFDLWHDRALFHFLSTPLDRSRYVAQVQRAVRPGGYVLVATFAPDGPPRCSGLEVVRYSAENLQEEFGAGFRLARSMREEHHTPDGRVQMFTYCLCRNETPTASRVP